ncbi:FAD-dependent oxidoreductase [Thioalkalicoccus limnaeus]|uniref:FAD-dependent oxidoreductase n=1 Tax=Thioalkalicoccus limnaeus TaxID=120681 RepID=A0ABV4BIK1_9GAMM
MTASTRYDCLIVGGGVTGTALLYLLARFTDLSRLALVERDDVIGQGNSRTNNNSQTIHAGDIETNYPFDKALAAKRAAQMVVNYASRRPPAERDRIIHRMPKMVLGVGAAECAYIERRFDEFRESYPRMQLWRKAEIAEIEPQVALVEGTWREDPILAAGTLDDYSAIDFQALSESFFRSCVRLDRRTDKHVTQLSGTKVASIRRDGPDYVLQTNRGPLQARAVVVNAGGHSLRLAQQMGHGLQYSCLSLAGSFYFTRRVLNGKVYRVQNPDWPFAAIHGDLDVQQRDKTRFGPTTLIWPTLERRGTATLREYWQVLRFDRELAATLWDLMMTTEVRRQIQHNLLYQTPRLGRRYLIREIRKIVPSLEGREIHGARGSGGIRHLLIDKEHRQLHVGGSKIVGDPGLIFNVTPSPGGTRCLSNAEADMRLLAKHLRCRINERALTQELLTGPEDVGGTDEAA